MKKLVLLLVGLSLLFGCGVGFGTYTKKTADSETKYWGLMGPVIPSAAGQQMLTSPAVVPAVVYVVPAPVYRMRPLPPRWNGRSWRRW